ncbi:MAG: hypothetical protein ACRCSP_01860 [Rhodoglobus sp.]
MSLAQFEDPVPPALDGDPDAVGAKAAMFTKTAKALRDAIDGLRELATNNVVISEAVDEIRTKAVEASTKIAKVELRYQGAAEAMSTYSGSLAGAIRRADAARLHIMHYNNRASLWRSKLHDLTVRAQGGEVSPELLEEIRIAKYYVAGFAVEFQNAMSEYNAAEQDKESAVATAIAALHFAAEVADLDDGIRDKVADLAVTAFKVNYEMLQKHLAPVVKALRTVIEYVKPFVDLLAFVFTVLAVVLPIFGPLAVALTLLSLGLGALMLLSSLVLVGLGKEKIGRVVGDAIGLAVGFFATKLGGLDPLKSGAALGGFSNLFSRSAHASGVSAMKLTFALNRGAMGTTQAVSNMVCDMGAEVYKTAPQMVGLSGSLAAGTIARGLDVQLDFFPEGANGGDFMALSGGWDLTAQEAEAATQRPLMGFVTAGSSGPIFALHDKYKLLVGAS